MNEAAETTPNGSRRSRLPPQALRSPIPSGGSADESQFDHMPSRFEPHTTERRVHAFHRSRLAVYPGTTLRMVRFAQVQQRRIGVLHRQPHSPIGAVGLVHRDGAPNPAARHRIQYQRWLIHVRRFWRRVGVAWHYTT